MTLTSPQITEFFGPFLAYANIIEKSFLFGRFPLYWDNSKKRIVLHFSFVRNFTFLTNLGTGLLTYFIPCCILILQYKLKLFPFLRINIPRHVFSFYVVVLALVMGLLAMFLSIIGVWRSYTRKEIERSFLLFQRQFQGNSQFLFTKCEKNGKL